VCDRQDLHARLSFAVNYGKRKAPNNESPRRVLADGPSVRRFDDNRNGVLDFLDKLLCGGYAALHVPRQS
jgi:hypothetical protein